MKQRDSRLYRSQDHKIRSRKGARKKKEDRPRPRREPPPERKKTPPAPWFLGGVLAFTVLFILSVYLGYEIGPLYMIPDLLMMGAVLCMIYSAYKGLDFCQCHWEAHNSRCKASVAVLAITIAIGLVISSYIFVVKEPYHNWQYEADLTCTSGCKVQIPAPMKEKDEAFFRDNDIQVDGPGNAKVIELRYEGKAIMALEIEWSGDLSLRAVGNKDYRDLPMDRHGLWNTSNHTFIVVGKDIPDDGNVTFELGFFHQHKTREYKEESWRISGKVGTGANMYEKKGY